MRLPCVFVLAVCLPLIACAKLNTALLKGMAVRPIIAEGTYVRYAYEGSTLKRDGRLLPLVENTADVTGMDVLEALKRDGADLRRYNPRVFHSEMGWAPVEDSTRFCADEATSPASCINGISYGARTRGHLPLCVDPLLLTRCTLSFAGQ
jgi:hypothetical protein